MRRVYLALACAMALVHASCSADTHTDNPAPSNSKTIPSPQKPGMKTGQKIEAKMKIIIGSRSFTATLYDNPTVTRLKAMLPLTLDMSELNGNEKYFRFSTDLPTDASNPGTIRTDDLMLWGTDSLVLFYKTFPTSYSYTKLGRIENPSELSSAVGSKNVRLRSNWNRLANHQPRRQKLYRYTVSSRGDLVKMESPTADLTK